MNGFDVIDDLQGGWVRHAPATQQTQTHNTYCDSCAAEEANLPPSDNAATRGIDAVCDSDVLACVSSMFGTVMARVRSDGSVCVSSRVNAIVHNLAISSHFPPPPYRARGRAS
jgi:hypothetical protein